MKCALLTQLAEQHMADAGNAEFPADNSTKIEQGP